MQNPRNKKLITNLVSLLILLLLFLSVVTQGLLNVAFEDLEQFFN